MGSLRPGPRDAGDVQLGGSHASWGGECVLGGLVCYDYGLDDGSVQNVAAALFVGLVVAWAVAIFASYASRRGARSDMGYYFSAGCLLGLVCVQWYYVFLAANHAPPSIMPAHTRRHDCLRSRKGGKRSSVDKLNPGGVQGLDVNPCFCHPYARCFDPLTGYVYHEASTADTIVENSNIQCPTDGSARCEEADGNLVPIHTQTTLRPTDRDCRHGRGAHCTEKDPCTPCEAETAALDPHAGYCMFCTADDRGKCHFKQGVGPYCKDGDGGARPCETCCTARRQVIVDSHVFLGRAGEDSVFRTVKRCAYAVHPKWRPSFCKKTPAETCELAGKVPAAMIAVDQQSQDECETVRSTRVVATEPWPPRGPDNYRIVLASSEVLMDLTRHGPGNATAVFSACVGGLPATPAPAPSPEPTPALGDLDT